MPTAGGAGAWTVVQVLQSCAVSPDYPYLALGTKGAAVWADLMHYQQHR